MLFLAIALLAFGLADLVGGRREEEDEVVGRFWTTRRLGGVVAGAVAATLLAGLSGYRWTAVAAIFAATLVALLVWMGLWASKKETRKKVARISLLWLLGTLAVAVAVSSLAAPIHGPLADWYGKLRLDFVEEVTVGQFVLAGGAFLFALATSNRIVIDALALTDVETTEVQSPLKGGRFLGPMERLIVGAVIVAGDPAAAAIVIAAKGLLRFPEITRKRSDGESTGDDDVNTKPPPGPDENTEYFLIGTFSSLIVAAVLAILVSAVS